VADSHELGMWLRKAYLSFHRRANARMLKHGVTADQFVVLSELVREEGVTQVTIVDRTASDPNTARARAPRSPCSGSARSLCLFDPGRTARAATSSERSTAASRGTVGEHARWRRR
jgi:hypothetical protein